MNHPNNNIYLFKGSSESHFKYWMIDYLSDSEKKRSQAMSNEHIKSSYIACRFFLKKVLSENLKKPISAINIEYGTNGKPYLNNENIYFNCSHSDNHFVIVVNEIGTIGIDIENKVRDFEISKIANLILSNEEQTKFFELTTEEQRVLFLKIWTIKEAFFKAFGNGLTSPLKNVSVQIDDDYTARLCNSFANQFDLNNWKILIPNFDTDLIGAVAINSSETCNLLIRDLEVPSKIQLENFEYEFHTC